MPSTVSSEQLWMEASHTGSILGHRAFNAIHQKFDHECTRYTLLSSSDIIMKNLNIRNAATNTSDLRILQETSAALKTTVISLIDENIDLKASMNRTEQRQQDSYEMMHHLLQLLQDSRSPSKRQRISKAELSSTEFMLEYYHSNSGENNSTSIEGRNPLTTLTSPFRESHGKARYFKDSVVSMHNRYVLNVFAEDKRVWP